MKNPFKTYKNFKINIVDTMYTNKTGLSVKIISLIMSPWSYRQVRLKCFSTHTYEYTHDQQSIITALNFLNVFKIMLSLIYHIYPFIQFFQKTLQEDSSVKRPERRLSTYDKLKLLALLKNTILIIILLVCKLCIITSQRECNRWVDSSSNQRMC